MERILMQPWYVDVGVLLLPIAVFLLVREITRPRGCFVCGHKAVEKRHNRPLCARCLRVKYGESQVVFERVKFEGTMPLPTPPAPVAAMNGSRRTKTKRRKVHKKAK